MITTETHLKIAFQNTSGYRYMWVLTWVHTTLNLPVHKNRVDMPEMP